MTQLIPIFLTLQFIFPITKKVLYNKNQISLFTMCIDLLHTQHIIHHINTLYILEMHYIWHTLNSTSTQYHYISHTLYIRNTLYISKALFVIHTIYITHRMVNIYIIYIMHIIHNITHYKLDYSIHHVNTRHHKYTRLHKHTRHWAQTLAITHTRCHTHIYYTLYIIGLQTDFQGEKIKPRVIKNDVWLQRQRWECLYK